MSAPAAVLGPNHSPTSLPSSLPINAILCTLYGHKGDGSSRNHVRILTYFAYASTSASSWGVLGDVDGFSVGSLQPAFNIQLGHNSRGSAAAHLCLGEDGLWHSPTCSARCAAYIPSRNHWSDPSLLPLSSPKVTRTFLLRGFGPPFLLLAGGDWMSGQKAT